MKKLIFIFGFILMSAWLTPINGQNYYEQQWKLIKAQAEKGQYKSNLPAIKNIQKQAMKDKNLPELIKSLKAEFSIVKMTQDHDKNNTASQFFKDIDIAGQSFSKQEKLVLDILKANYIKDHYEQNRWQINTRTNLDSQDLTQIETWSKLAYKNYLTKAYGDIFGQSSVLKTISTNSYKSIFDSDYDAEYFPTILDWASSEYLEFMKNNGLFTKNELTINQKKITSLYDELITNNSGNAKLYFQTQKLDWQNITPKDKKLEAYTSLFNSNEKGDYKVMIASQIIEQLIADKKPKEAIILINNLQKDYPKSRFIGNIKNLENNIVQPIINLFMEPTMLPNQPIMLLAEAKNVKQFSINIYKVDNDIKGFLAYVNDNYNNKFSTVKKTLVRKDNFELKTLGDYDLHKTALEMKALPAGIYMIDYTVDGDKSQRENNLYFLVSQAKSILKNVEDNNTAKNSFVWINADNGKPIANKTLKITEYLAGKKDISISNLKLSADGNYQLPTFSSDSYYRYYLIQNTETGDVELKQNYGSRVSTSGSKKAENEYKAQIFLDRAIYRPGQIVYFKVISTKLIDNKESVLSSASQKVILEDANGQEISNQIFKTNQFGSYNGSFTLPKGKLNGRFTINIEDDANDIDESKDFLVEEYKRPNFEVTFEPIKGEYKYGEKVELKGKATTFSGIALSNATVNYDIKKQNIRWRYFSWYPRSFDNENSILGEVKTNDKGEFTIILDLKKDEKIDGIQIDNYAINASVTDISGETQTANTSLTVSSVTHYITADTVNSTFSDDNIDLNVETKNYNGQSLKKNYQVKLSKLEEPQRIFRNQFKTQIQDLPNYSKEEFEKLFPHDRFDKKDLETNWNIQKTIIEKTATDSKLSLGKLDAGYYRLDLYNIEGKDTIKTSQDFRIWNKSGLASDQKNFLTLKLNQKEYKAGEQVKLYIYSAIPDATLHIYTQLGDGKTKYETKSLTNGLYIYETKIGPTQKTLNVQVNLAAYNDVQSSSIYVPIVTDKKSLTIETVTFRDKLQPGTKEKWSFKVKGGKDASTALSMTAEVLASMYDKSLDQFASNSYSFQPLYYRRDIISSYNMSSRLQQLYYSKNLAYKDHSEVVVPRFSWFDGNIVYTALYGSTMSLQGSVAGVKVKASAMAPAPSMRAKGYDSDSIKEEKIEIVQNVVPEPKRNPKVDYAPPGVENFDDVKVRENLNETAFFYPQLLTDKDGNVSFEFTSPEALTQWKLMLLAHTKDAQSAYLEKTVVTQKDFSVTPNYPRFLREGDVLNFQTKVSSLVDKALTGSAKLQILDAFTNEDISDKFGLSQLTAVSGYNVEQSFKLDSNSSTALGWTVKVPKDISSIIIKVVAKAGEFSDGEQKAIAVLPNRMLVTDATPIFVKEGETKTFTIDNLINNTSKTATNVSNTLELTTNPIWEIMFALPSLKNDVNNSADVIFNKWFADVLASEIFKSNPKLKTVFDDYQSKGLLTSNLEKNQELKQLLLDETPWVLDSKNEEEQMQKLARLFDANTMRNSIQADWSELSKLQNPDGGFSWYQGYPSSYYTSLYILKNLGKINVWLKGNAKDYQSEDQKTMVKNLVNYVDSNINKYWDARKENPWSNASLEFLDVRRYWEKDHPLTANPKALKDMVIKKAKSAKITDFTFFGLHRSALLFDQYGLKDVSKKLLTYLKETSTESKTQGIYWKQNLNNWGWYNSNVVNQAGALEAFNLLTPTDTQLIEEMKIWLITQKEVNAWGSSRSTAEVIFTILNSGKSWTSADSDKVTIVWGRKELTNPDTKATGYVKSTLRGEQIDSKLGTVTVTKPGAGIVQGGLFWQYYEDLDKIKSSENYISITKEYYRKVKTENGEELKPISANVPIKVGDKITVRMILNTDRNMEYIHLKDMRAAGLEPLDVISGYQWKNNLGYYQSTKDASNNFYIEYMPKGKYVFEYDLVANASGTFSNGISTLQNYYAPQMNSHSKGSTLEIKAQ
ncbi:alpha-2-macroglobulin family protein [Chryseobacterium sp. T1]